ncbi:something about silencing, SAS, complex subunit 4-domain-containing protein [Podospora fimiseda]|uniref:Something about silencing, SAS, complex subunit 4-domain-containing protein n=1 Tax=Podospora fimiseda TaxID=252190 RepID=A0AAN7H4U3_9PEZI|nr:something about silencing, SAS, complex subunit 4-domain-containing protein [Podospora fimiseda]
MAMTTSMTRSTRRAEGLHAHPHKISNGHRLIANNANQQQQQQRQFAAAVISGSSPPRGKRQLEDDNHDSDRLVHKKPRFTTGIAVEIPARPSYQSRIATRESADAKPSHPPKAYKPTILVHPPPVAPPPATRAPLNKSLPHPPAESQKQKPALTKHQEKVVNGLKHELGRLQPNAADTAEQQGGRKLRSQEATRFKSELSAYFPEYDEVIGNEPKEDHLLTVDTPIVITSDPAPTTNTTEGSSRPLPHPQLRPHQLHHAQPKKPYPVRGYGDALFTQLSESERIDFHFLNKIKTLRDDDDDPLPDSVYVAAHKKAERTERSIRNSEKGRAQHERDQIIRLLDGLQGHDWLRVMGVSGITETRKKQFEPAREYFISGCKLILDKFRRWAAEEKRRKQEKERAAAEAEKRAEREVATSEEQDNKTDSSEGKEIANSDDDEEAEDDEDDEKDDEDEDQDDEDEDESGETDEETDVEEEDPPDYSDVEASIAKQLRVEAMAAAVKKPQPAAASRRGKAAPPPPQPPPRPLSPAPPPPPPPKRELTSFFAKPYQREAALSKNRRKGRNVLAWGQPIPESEEKEFELPGWVKDMDENLLKARARKRRREKRVR